MDKTAFIAIIYSMNHSLKILLEQDIRNIFDSFTRLMDIRIVFLTVDGSELEVGGNRQRCGYCNTLRVCLGYEKHCRQMDMKMARQANRENKLLCYKCYAGLVEAVKPIVINDNCLGYIMIGQIRTSQKLTACTDFLKSLSVEEFAALEQEFEGVPYYEEKNVDDILRLFEMLADFIISHRLIAIKNADAVEMIKDYIHGNTSDFLTLEAAAAMVHKSKSFVSHGFKERTGGGLNQYQIGVKIERAKQLLTEDATASVKEIAFTLGFTDALYFSRLFKRKSGLSPTVFRQQNTLPKD